MKLDPTEYERGILFWEADLPSGYRVAFETATSDDPSGTPGSAVDWRGPFADPEGSKVQSPPYRYVRLRAKWNPALPAPRFKEIRWEREHSTSLWAQDAAGQPRPTKRLTLAPDYGNWYRVVVDCSRLDWSKDAILRGADTRIRFVHGSITGYKLSPFDRYEVADDGKVSLVGGEAEEVEATGRLLEILVRGTSLDEAKERAQGVLGLLALAIGQQVLGDEVFAEELTITEESEQGHLQIPVRTGVGRLATESEFAGSDVLLPLILGDTRMQRARLLALTWYHRGLTSPTPLDQLISFFIGIELLASAHAADQGTLPEVEERRRALTSVLVPPCVNPRYLLSGPTAVCHTRMAKLAGPTIETVTFATKH